jgi:predicted amidohydrolase
MANRITISAVGPNPPTGFRGIAGQAAVDAMQQHWTREIAQVLPDKPDLVVVPEACDRFPEHTREERLAYYRFRGNSMRDFFARIARDNHCYIAYSAARELPDGTWRNSTQIIDRQGSVVKIYDKNHVVIEETTEDGILCGRDSDPVATDFGSLSCAICFDLNFDEILAKTRANRPDVVVFCSMYHGGLMQSYWAYRCKSHFVGAIAGAPPSTVINPLGETLAESTNYFDFVTSRVNLDCCVVHLDCNWEKLAAARRKYGPGVVVHDPGNLGAVLVTSEMDAVSARDIVKELGIELWDDYYDRAMTHRRNHTAPR